MLNTTPTLLAAARSASAIPYVRVQVADRDAGAVRLHLARWYEGDEPAGPAGAASPADGSLVRARIDPTSGELFVQRVAAPTAEAAYDSWSSLGVVEASAGLGLHAAGTRVLVAYSDGSAVRVRESTDSGATFGSATTVASVSGSSAVGCAVRADGSALAAWADDGVVSVASRSIGGSWGSPSTWAHSLEAVNALAVSDQTDWAILVSGEDAEGQAGVWTTRYGSGVGGPPGHWSALTTVILAAPGTDVTYRAAGIVNAGVPRVLLVESYAGPGAFDQALMATAVAGFTFPDGEWRDPVPLGVAAPYGVAATRAGSSVFVCAPDGVWHTSVASTPVDISARVIEARYEARADEERLRLVLDPGEALDLPDAAPGLEPGGEITFGPGYVTDAGLEFSPGRALWITSMRQARGVLEVEAEGAFGLLRRWRASRQFTWDAGTRTATAITGDIARFAGLTFAGLAASDVADGIEPPFAIRAGEDGATAMRRLLRKVPDLAYGRGALFILRDAPPGEAAVAAFGPDAGQHPVAASGLEDPRDGIGWARAFGDGVVAQAVDLDATLRGGSVALAVDESIGTAGDAGDLAATILRRAAMAEERAWLEATPHPGLEPGDVVEVTEPALALDATRYRVVCVRYDFARRRRARYRMRVCLGVV